MGCTSSLIACIAFLEFPQPITVMFFETKRTTYLPGYTDHVSLNYYEEVEQSEPAPPHVQIPGYAGYIPSV